jgi:hypothetical protein
MIKSDKNVSRETFMSGGGQEPYKATRLKILKGLKSYEFIIEQWTKKPEQFRLNPIHQTPGSNSYRKSEMITELSDPIIFVRTSTSPSNQRSRAKSLFSVSAIL